MPRRASHLVFRDAMPHHETKLAGVGWGGGGCCTATATLYNVRRERTTLHYNFVIANNAAHLHPPPVRLHASSYARKATKQGGAKHVNPSNLEQIWAK